MGVGTIIRAKETSPCPVDVALLSDTPLILQDNLQFKQRDKSELSAGHLLMSAGPAIVVSQAIVFPLKLSLYPTVRSSCLYLVESSLRI